MISNSLFPFLSLRRPQMIAFPSILPRKRSHERDYLEVTNRLKIRRNGHFDPLDRDAQLQKGQTAWRGKFW
mgnify:CR=1 FL=1